MDSGLLMLEVSGLLATINSLEPNKNARFHYQKLQQFLPPDVHPNRFAYLLDGKPRLFNSLTWNGFFPRVARTQEALLVMMFSDLLRFAECRAVRTIAILTQSDRLSCCLPTLDFFEKPVSVYRIAKPLPEARAKFWSNTQYVTFHEVAPERFFTLSPRTEN